MIKYNEAYLGKLINDWKPEYKGAYIITGLQQGENTMLERIGKVVQVRKESGVYGSDTVLIRHSNDVLSEHQNQSYFLIPNDFHDYLDLHFKDTYSDDSDKNEYSINGEKIEKGFIIPSRIPETESTPMRDVKSALGL